MLRKEPLRCIENARELLAKSPIEEHICIEEKYVRLACGVAYLGVLKAIDEYLLRKGRTRKRNSKKS
jgi:Domain of unknown function (DUF5618)